MQIRDRVRELRRVKASDLLPSPRNWRTHPQPQADALRGVLSEIGYADALLARETEAGLMLVDGHLRAETTPDALVPVLVLDVTEAEADKLLLTLDPLAGMAEANNEVLKALMDSLEFDSPAVKEMLDGLARDSGILAEQVQVVEDEVPEPPKVPVTKPGDLWVLGEHRLLCGDSTDRQAVERLMGGEKAALCFTSPPYAQQRDYTAESKGQDWDTLMQGVFGNLPMADDGQVLVNLGLVHRDGEWWPYWDGWIEWMRGQGWRRFGWYVWDQLSGFPGVRGLRTTGAEKIPDSVWRIGRAPDGDIKHSAKFPVEFAAFAIKSWPGLAYEPFSGSGTTIIAGEQLGRPVRAIEISPAYVDVAVERWEKLTGEKAVLQ